jgi:hypothetical protein
MYNPEINNPKNTHVSKSQGLISDAIKLESTITPLLLTGRILCSLILLQLIMAILSTILNFDNIHYRYAFGFITFMIIFMCFFFESFRKKGYVYFEEISNFREWKIAAIEPGPQSISSYNDYHDVRMIARRFLSASDLLFIPGKYGPASYIIFSFLLTIIKFSLLSKY